MAGEATGGPGLRGYSRPVHRPAAAWRREWSRCGALAVGWLLVVAVVPGCATGEDDLDGSAPTVTSTPLPDPAAAVTNGVDGRPADAVLDQALANLLAAGSYRVSGSPSADEPLDLRYAAGATLARPDDGGSGADPTAAVGRGVTGTLTTQGSTFEILAVDGQVFVRGDLTWLSTQVAPEALTTLGQKWLLLPRSAAVALASFVDPDLFATALLDPQGPLTPVGASVVTDRPAWGLRSVETGAITWVTGTGAVLPVQVERPGATATAGTLTFADVGAEVALVAPAADQVVVVADAAPPVG
jgi:hypothetical protein